MERDEVFSVSEARGSDFEFDSHVVAVFDDMVVRSIPFYEEQQRMIQELGARLWVPGTDVYDLGCATATTLINLREAIGPNARFTGYDNSAPMRERARQKIHARGLGSSISVVDGDLDGHLAELSLANAGLITMCWTLQFVRPLRRNGVVQRIADSLVDDGVLLVTEKILTGHGQLNPLFIQAYYDLKRRSGYSDHEIAKKREALENVLVPYRIEENRELFLRNGFDAVETFFQWYNFVGFLCLKKSRRGPARATEALS